jgi:hypothetical protein
MTEGDKSPREGDITIKENGDVFEKAPKRGDILDKEGNIVPDGEGVVTYRIKMPESEPKDPSPGSNN